MFDKIRAQFWVQKSTKQAAAKGQTTLIVEMAAVTRSTGQPGYEPEGNTDWSKYTPSGRIEMAISNPDAAAIFDANIGRDVRVTFEFIDPPSSQE